MAIKRMSMLAALSPGAKDFFQQYEEWEKVRTLVA